MEEAGFKAPYILMPHSISSVYSEYYATKYPKEVEAIIYSMTPQERETPEIINGSRRKRIAAGSGTTIQEVNRLIKQFEDTRKVMKMMSQGKNLSRMMANMPMGKR